MFLVLIPQKHQIFESSKTINMKNSILVILFLFYSICTTQAQEEEIDQFDLTIEIKGIENNKGKIYIAIYDSEETFLKKAKGENRNNNRNFLSKRKVVEKDQDSLSQQKKGRSIGSGLPFSKEERS